MRWLMVPGLHCRPEIWRHAAEHGVDAVCVSWPTEGVRSMDEAARWLERQVLAYAPDGVVGHSLGGLALLHLYGQLGRRPRLPLVIADSFLTPPHPMFRNHVWEQDALRARVEAMLDEERPKYAELRAMTVGFVADDPWIQSAVATGATFLYGGRGGEVEDATLARRAGVPVDAVGQVRVVPRCAHFAMLEAPGAFYGLVEAAGRGWG